MVDARYGEKAQGFLSAREAGTPAADILAELHGVREDRHRQALEQIRRDFLAPETR